MIKTSDVIQSTCTQCPAGCGILIYMKDGKPVKVAGNPAHPTNKGMLCSAGNASLEYLTNPQRLTYPVARAGAKGESKWHKISWDEALEKTANGLKDAKAKYGVESVAFIQGGFKGYSDSFLARLANVFGTPNIASMSYICFHARLRGMLATYGFMSRSDCEYPSNCIVLWGINPSASAFPLGDRILEAINKGAKLIVIDPGETLFSKKADIWVKPKPGSDLALALGMLNVIINENLYDKEFVNKWTSGFDELKVHIGNYSPEKVSELTWVPADIIKNISRMYASNKPACIISGNGQDNGVNNYQFSRAASILRAISGNIGIPGGEVEYEMPNVLPINALELHRYELISPELRSHRIGAEEKTLPNYFSTLPQKLVKTMLTSKPYPVRAAFVQGGSLLHTYSNVREAYDALKSLDFMAVTDFFMTPTAELADVVMPAATFLETDYVCSSGDSPVTSVVQKVAQVGESWSDYKIIQELSKRLGLADYYWENDVKAMDLILKPTGLTFDEFRHVGMLHGKKIYRGYEKKGFNTSSGKVEIYSSKLKEWGFDPLPDYIEPLPESKDQKSEYPLILTSMKQPGYIHSRGRQVKSLRNSRHEPLVTINTNAAKQLGILGGDWVYIENKQGKIKQKAVLSNQIHPEVLIAEFGWWFPEKENDLHGWAESNFNILTASNPPYSRELGSVTLKGIPCRISKA